MTRTPLDRPRLLTLLLPLLLTAFPRPAHAQTSTLLGDWREPGGSVLRIDQCNQDLCAHLIQLSATAPGHLDAHNPDPAQRTRALCGLQIGYGFHRTAPDHAEGGHLYDPKSGKTYQGEMTASGDHLNLRGFVGIRAFGRSEQWTRTSAAKTTCD